MRVSLIEFTGSGWPDPADRAATVMIFTKSTRLQMSPTLLEEISAWPQEKKMQELAYMANTIPSSWEMCDYTFMIEGVTRAFTHQLVRTRTASFAQQTMRILNVATGPGWSYGRGPSLAAQDESYDGTMKVIDTAYQAMIKKGVKIEDARGILPTNILTNIVMKINMRNWVDMVRKRSSSRTQGEYRDVLEQMKSAVQAVHPWIDLFIDRTQDRAITDLEAIIKSQLAGSAQTDAVKLLDQLRALS
jgi:flavin-dependent thymidylate synthase